MAGIVAGPAQAASASAPAAPPGSIGLQLLDAPVAGRGDPRAQLYITDHVAPGTSIRRRVRLTNTTSSSVSVNMYAGDATIGHGTFLGAAGRGRGEPSIWTSIVPAVSQLPAGDDATAMVTIRVPGDAAPGERYGIAWAEVRDAPGAGAGITQVSRVGIRLYISVGPGGAPTADFAIDALRPERSADGLPMVVATVRNTGGRALDMNGTVALARGPGGLSAGPFPARLGTTLGIGDTERVTTFLDRQMPSGPWAARVTLRSGLLERKAHATITFPGGGESSDHWVALAGALGLLLLLLAASMTDRRRRQAPLLTPPLINRQ